MEWKVPVARRAVPVPSPSPSRPAWVRNSEVRRRSASAERSREGGRRSEVRPVSAVAAAPHRSPGARKEVGAAGGSPKGGEGVLVERLVQSLEDCVRRSQDASSMLSRLTQQNEEVAREIRSVEEDKQMCAERVERAEERTAVASDELDRLRASLAPAAASMARLHALRNERFLLTQALVATDRDRRLWLGEHEARMQALRTRKEERALAASQRARALEDRLGLARGRVDAARVALLQALSAGDSVEALREEVDTMRHCLALAAQPNEGAPAGSSASTDSDFSPSRGAQAWKIQERRAATMKALESKLRAGTGRTSGSSGSPQKELDLERSSPARTPSQEDRKPLSSLQETVARARAVARARIDKLLASASLVAHANRERRAALERLRTEIADLRAAADAADAQTEAARAETRAALARLRGVIVSHHSH